MFVLFDLIPILILSWMFVLFDLIPILILAQLDVCTFRPYPNLDPPLEIYTFLPYPNLDPSSVGCLYFSTLSQSWSSVGCLYFSTLSQNLDPQLDVYTFLTWSQLESCIQRALIKYELKGKGKCRHFFGSIGGRGPPNTPQYFIYFTLTSQGGLLMGPLWRRVCRQCTAHTLFLYLWANLKNICKTLQLARNFLLLYYSVRNKIKILDSIARPFTSHTRGAAKFFHICLFLLL